MRRDWLPGPICPRLGGPCPEPAALPGGLSRGQTVHPVVLFWGDHAAGPATCLTGPLWPREKRALSGSSEEPAAQWGPLCPHPRDALDGRPARPRPLLGQAGPWAQRRGGGGLANGSPLRPVPLQLEIRLTPKAPSPSTGGTQDGPRLGVRGPRPAP